MTLTELVVVIAIIVILAGLLLPDTIGHNHAREKMAQIEMANLGTAISQYQAEYGILPASAIATNAAGALGSDFTFGTVVNGAQGSPLNGRKIVSNSVCSQDVVTPGSPYQNVNSEVIAILTAADYYPENSVNRHTYNSRMTPFFAGRPAASASSPGVDTNCILRDPWGLPYILTLDLNHDGRCVDPIWSKTIYPLAGNTNFSVPGSSMIWSFGYLQHIDLTQPPNGFVNKYLLKSWQ